MKLKIELTKKQTIAWDYLTDDVTTEVGYGGGARGGKDVAVDTLVLTDSGWKQAGDVTMSDRLVTVDGSYTNIIGIFPQGLKKTYEFVFDDGAKCEVGLNHQWLVKSSKHGKRDGWVVRDTQFLLNSTDRYSIPLLDVAPELSGYEAKYDPYILGYILGNGTLTGAYPCIYTAEKEITEYLALHEWRVYKYRDNVWQCQKSKDFDRIFEEIEKTSGINKHVPDKLLNASALTRLALLQGLMDSDGSVSDDGSCTFSNTSHKLCEAVQYLTRSLGGKATIHQKKRKLKSGKTEYSVRVSHCGRFDPFRLTRKAEKIKTIVYDKRYIRSIKPCRAINTVCFAVEHPSHLFVIQDFILTHNSWLGAEFINFMCIVYPRTRWAIGRRELKNLKRTTLLTLFKVYAKHKMKKDADFSYNEQQSKITYSNGSEVYLLDLAYEPSDPLFTWMGGLELTGAWIDESNEVKGDAVTILKSRVGNCNNDTYNIKPLLLETFNPSKGHIYTRYYKPYKDGNQLEYRKFIPALASDNPHIPQSYIEELKRAPLITRERLLYGNFDYDDDPMRLFDYDAVQNIFTNTYVEGGERYITGDVGGKGKDKTVLYVWEGWRVIHTFYESITNQADLIRRVESLRERFSVPLSHTLLDYNGIGTGAVDVLGCVPFNAGMAPIESEASVWGYYEREKKPMYKNLRSQLWIYLAEEIVNKNRMYIDAEAVEFEGDPVNIKEIISEELDVMKEIVEGGETKRAVISKGSAAESGSKQTIRQLLGRSPDFGDGIMMRAYFDVGSVSVDYSSISYI